MRKEYQLPEEFATKWTAALRSGQYQQTCYNLKNGDRYCALGVAGSVAGDDTALLERESICLGSWSNTPDVLHSGSALGLRIMELNDDLKKSFPDIADWIGQNVEIVPEPGKRKCQSNKTTS